MRGKRNPRSTVVSIVDREQIRETVALVQTGSDPVTFNPDSFVSVALETYRVMMLILRGSRISATKCKAADFIQANIVNSADES